MPEQISTVELRQHLAWPATVPAEALAVGDAYIEEHAAVCDSIFPGLGGFLRDIWRAIRPSPSCDCPLDPYHRWNCALTPIWAQTIRDLDTNPWTVIKPWDLAMVSTGCSS
ncbi:hypothetical protein [Mycolicibacterium fluoranthenivorans]|uniref:Uncharacterized protein n=1 Tax=Mycolicibacterium fluoranthenivorans TaxID=258505 RepID=A0A7X5U5X3_9MYCO|nr:hypothetical protein [Mycolicibacterium fluoranthenivorans]MCV7354470.1 hypothetical protein [Mycolicibacterium fluoranthenivorans]NIH98927.1 hypothetical protein [Mycolicibacterium fluoranthenivorans]